MGVVSPFVTPEAFDAILLGGTAPSPGICRVKSCVRKYSWDLKIGKGTNYATFTFTGIPPAGPELEFTLVNDEDWQGWAEFLPNFQYDPTKLAAFNPSTNPSAVGLAIDIWHPILALQQITRVIAVEVGEPVMQPDFRWIATVKLIEWNKASTVSAVATVSGASAGGNPVPPGQATPDANAALKSQLQQSAANAAAAGSQLATDAKDTFGG